MSSTTFRNKNFQRPRKNAAQHARRDRVHRRRLIALGVPEDQVMKMTAPEMRKLLRHPAKLAKA